MVLHTHAYDDHVAGDNQFVGRPVTVVVGADRLNRCNPKWPITSPRSCSFGLPNNRAMDFLGEPPVVIGPLYEAKTIKVCAPEDFVCSDGLNFAAHNPTAYDGSLTDQGAAFAASRLGGLR